MYKLVWVKTVPGYERYEADAISGEIRSKEYRHSGKPHVLKPFYVHREKNYLGLNLWKDGKQGSPIPVHVIIAKTFPEVCGEWFDGAVVHHKDKNPHNNSAFNLLVMSNSEHVKYHMNEDVEFRQIALEAGKRGGETMRRKFRGL